jgi:spore coat protein CotH
MTRSSADSWAIVSEPLDDASAMFDPALLRTYELVISPAHLASIDADPAAEAWVPATLVLEGESIAVGARYKGSVGSFLMPCTAASAPGAKRGPKTGKCSMKVAFDHFDPAARYKGLRKLNFHAMGRDPSSLRERLGYSLFREMGVAAPRAAHVRLLVNGQLEGLFLAVEEIDGRFTRARFEEGGEGNLYKEVWPIHDTEDPYRKALESNRAVDADVSRMIAFHTAIAAADASVAQRLDRDYTLRWMAVDRVIMNDDGAFHWYCYSQGKDAQGIPLPPLVRNHNFYWYEAAAEDHHWIVPWDLDNSFVTETSRVHIDPEWSNASSCDCKVFLGLPQRPAACDPLFARFASWQSDLDAAIETLLAGPFAPERIEARLTTWSAQIEPIVTAANGALGAPDATAWQTALMQLRASIELARTHRGYPYP